jgi:two-component system response regulator YesN
MYEFRLELEKISNLLVLSSNNDTKEAGKRLTSLASNLFFSILPCKRELVLNYIIELSDTLKKVNKIENIQQAFEKVFFSVLVERESSHNSFSEEVIQYLKYCSTQELRQMTAQTLAEKFRYSLTYFPKKFLEEQGTTIHDAITYEKINRAFNMLSSKQEKKSVKEVASMLGFSDQRYFSRLFKSKFGLLPSQVANLETKRTIFEKYN